MKSAIADCEKTISEIIVNSEISQKEAQIICYLLGSILTETFHNQSKESGLRSWTVDDMYPDKVEVYSKKITMNGAISWLGGGGECVYYQVDIARNTDPLLYSYKLQDRLWKQVIYIGKTFKGWIVSSH